MATIENVGPTDASVEPYEPVPDASPITYPDTTAGMLMRERDNARANAAAAREQCERFAGFARDADARADSMQAAIDAMSSPT